MLPHHMKTRQFLFTILAIVSLAVLGPAADTAQAATAKTVRLLTVGNSFSGNATKYLPSLVTADGHTLIHRPIVVGGASLQLHADKAATNGLYANGHSLKQELAADKWDFVTIQQASIKSHDIATYRPFAKYLHNYIKQNAPGATVLMHETWEYRCDDARFAVKSPKAGEPVTQEAMYQGITNAYQTIAAELGMRLIPVGDAFHLADTDPQWGYKPDTKFDSKNAKSPALPDQAHSLHAGWRWTKDKLGMDGHHASDAGQYLGACVFYEVLFGESVVGNKFAPSGIDPAYVRFLQETAHRAVLNSRAKNN